MAQLFISKNKQTLILNCIYAEKDKAKRAGGIWDPQLKKWTFAFDLNILESLKKAFPELQMDEELETLIRIKRYEVNKIMNLKDAAVKNEPIEFQVDGLLFKGNNPLYNYQKHGVRCASYSDSGFLLADACGLGKSIQGLGVSLLMKKQKNFKNCLIVCPASVKYNWLNEISKFTNERAIVIDGNSTERFDKWFAPNVFYKIVNYELLARDLFFFGGIDKDNVPRDFRIPGYQQLIDGWFDMVILDEAHYIQGHSNQRTKALKGMKFKYKLALTGTPIDGALQGFHSIIEFIKPGLFPHIGKFLDRYAEFDHWGGIRRYINVNEFKEKISPYYVRRLTKDVLTDLPPVIHQNVYVELSEKAMKTYKKLAKREHKLTEDQERIVTIIRCRQFCDVPDILGLKDKSDKLDILEELLDEIVAKNEQKVIIFTQYREALSRIRERLGKKYGICELETGKTRFDSCEMFNKEEKYQIMLMTDAGSVGINLQSASYVINFDQNWSPAVMIQRYCRAWRNGQTNTVVVINLICKDTVEERVMEAISSKSQFSSEVLSEETDEMSLGNTLSTQDIFDLL